MAAPRNPSSAVPLLKAMQTPLVAVLVIALTASFAYAVVVAQILVWFIVVGTLAALCLSTYLVFLFYRLVVAVERIADES